jgi:hypothetical protein
MKEGITYALAVAFMLLIASIALYTPTERLSKLELKMDSLIVVVKQKDILIEDMLITINRKDSSFKEHMNECTFFSNKTIEVDKNRYIRLKNGFSLLKEMSKYEY